jgi:MFS family permease
MNMTEVYVLLIVSMISLVVFIVRERRIDYPLIDYKILRIRQVTGGIFAVLLNVIAWAAVLLLLSFQFQLVYDESPLQAGLSILPFEISFLAVGPLSGSLSDKFGHARFVLAGLALSSVAMFLFSTITQSTSYSILSVYMVILGVGTGLFLAPNLRGVMGSLPVFRRGVGSALVSLFLNVGLSVSLNFAVAIMTLTAPYGLISGIISGLNPMSITAAERTVFFDSIKNTYAAVALVNTLALIPAFLQIERRQGAKQTGPLPPSATE